MAHDKTALDTKNILEKLAILKQNTLDDFNALEGEKIKCFIFVGYRHRRAAVFVGIGQYGRRCLQVCPGSSTQIY